MCVHMHIWSKSTQNNHGLNKNGSQFKHLPSVPWNAWSIIWFISLIQMSFKWAHFKGLSKIMPHTVSSSMAQFVDKWQRKNEQLLLIFWEKQWFFSQIEHFSLIPGRLFFSKPNLLVWNRQNRFERSFRNFF